MGLAALMSRWTSAGRSSLYVKARTLYATPRGPLSCILTLATLASCTCTMSISCRKISSVEHEQHVPQQDARTTTL